MRSITALQQPQTVMADYTTPVNYSQPTVCAKIPPSPPTNSERRSPPFALAKQQVLGLIHFLSQVTAAPQIRVVCLHDAQVSLPDAILARTLSGPQYLGSLSLAHILQKSPLPIQTSGW